MIQIKDIEINDRVIITSDCNSKGYTGIVIGTYKAGYSRHCKYVMAKFCEQNGLKHVPIIDTEYVLPKTMEEMKLEADGYSEINPKVKREGFVYRSVDGQQSFKNVSREYLLKHNG